MALTRYKTVINAGDCYQLGDINRYICLPIKKDCTPTTKDWILNECGNNYCDTFNPQTDVPFNMIYLPGDKIQFQFRFDDNYNEVDSNPSDGWGTFVTGAYYAADGSLLSANYADYASKAMVGYDGASSYQIIEIDTALLAADGIKCWYFQATSHTTEPDVTQTICTELFSEALCTDTILIKGVYTQYDCFNNWYGDPVAYVGDLFKYDNTLRFKGKLWKSPDVIKRELVNQQLKTSTYDDIYNFMVHDIVPAYVMKTLTQHFNAPIILIDGNEYQCETYNPEKADTGFLINIEVYQRCILGVNNCNT